jgi:hypothetical protein
LDRLIRAKEEEAKREEDRLKKESEHQMRKQEKVDEYERKRLADEERRREQQRIAALRQQRLNELREKWVAADKEKVGSQETGEKKRKRSKVGPESDDDEDLLFGDENGDNTHRSDDNFAPKVESSTHALATTEDIFGPESDDENGNEHEFKIDAGGASAADDPTDSNPPKRSRQE